MGKKLGKKRRAFCFFESCTGRRAEAAALSKSVRSDKEREEALPFAKKRKNFYASSAKLRFFEKNSGSVTAHREKKALSARAEENLNERLIETEQ